MFLLILASYLIQASDDLAGFSPEAIEQAQALSRQALAGDGAWNIVESLTTEVGPRLAGTPGDAAAVAWGVAKLKELGFDKVWTEPVEFPLWERGVEDAEVVSPYPQKLIITALGGSVGTPEGGLEAELVHFPTLESLQDGDPEKVRGKIVYISNKMSRSKSGMTYGLAVGARSQGAVAAAKLGAKGIVIRSIGTDSHRFPHTGTMRYEEGVPRIPAAAMSNPDADLIDNMLRRKKPITIRMNMTCSPKGTATTHNVIGQINGRERPEEVVIIGGHLDSWDLGTGAIDDGAGVAITTEAARLIANAPRRPARSIRVIMYGNEEGGLWGARAYAERYKNDLDNQIIGAESDFGAGRIYRFDTLVDEKALPVMDVIHAQLEPLGVARGSNQARGGPDLQPIRALGMPVVTLQQDGTDYFDYHHTPDDTLDKIDPASLRQNVACYVVFAYLAADAPVSFRTGNPVAKPTSN